MANRTRRLSSMIFLACSVWLVGLGLYFIFLRPALLPEDPRFMGASIETIRSSLPGLERWLGHVFNVLGGFMTASGILLAALAWHPFDRRSPGFFAALCGAGIASVGLMSATNFAIASDFRWLLLVPVLLWAAGLAFFVREGTSMQRRAAAETVGVLAAAALLLGSVAWTPDALAQASPQARSSEAAGVAITVTPTRVTGVEWAFKVAMDTHSGALQDDLQQTAVLVLAGMELRPVRWTAPGSGHHREGSLEFSVPAPQSGPVELRITRPGEPDPRVFRWETLQ